MADHACVRAFVPYVFVWMVTVAAHSSKEVARAPYDVHLALEYAYISTAAYCGTPKSPRKTLEAWRCGPACDHVQGMQRVQQVVSDKGSISALIGRLHGRCVVGFRGSARIKNWLLNLASAWHANPNRYGINCTSEGKDCWVGSGWLRAYRRIREYIRGNLTAIGCQPGRDNVTVTGHSLGAAVAQIAMFDFSAQGYHIDTSYVFGSPRVGDTTWARAFETRLGLSTVFRVTFHHDPVPRLPSQTFGYMHAGTEVYYKSNMSEVYVVCAVPGEDPSCINSSGDIIKLIKRCLKGNCDHLKYMAPEKTISMSGASCAAHADASSIWV